MLRWIIGLSANFRMLVIAVAALPVIPSLVARIPIDEMIKQVMKAVL